MFGLLAPLLAGCADLALASPLDRSLAEAWPLAAPADVDQLAARYGLVVEAAAGDVVAALPGGAITGKAAGAADLPGYERMLAAEWALYPPALVARSGLKRLVLCDRLAFGGQARAAVPDQPHNTLYLDVATSTMAYRRAVLHHEYFHMIDLADDRALFADAGWAGLNRPDFAYDRGGASRQGRSDQFGLVDNQPGFLTAYATAAVEEDKAETFCFLMLDPAGVEARGARDPIVGFKVDRLKALLAAFVPALDGAYWETLKALRARP